MVPDSVTGLLEKSGFALRRIEQRAKTVSETRRLVSVVPRTRVSAHAFCTRTCITIHAPKRTYMQVIGEVKFDIQQLMCDPQSLEALPVNKC